MSKRAKQRGRFCWCCGRTRPNERFSGRGHARHLCRDCAKLGQEELAYRQAVRDIDRLLDQDGLVRRKHRKYFQRFLTHSDEKIRRYAEEVMANDAYTRKMYRQQDLAWEAEELDLGMESPDRGARVSFDSDGADASGPMTALVEGCTSVQ